MNEWFQPLRSNRGYWNTSSQWSAPQRHTFQPLRSNRGYWNLYYVDTTQRSYTVPTATIQSRILKHAKQIDEFTGVEIVPTATIQSRILKLIWKGWETPSRFSFQPLRSNRGYWNKPHSPIFSPCLFVPTATIQSRILKRKGRRMEYAGHWVRSNRYDPIEDTETSLLSFLLSVFQLVPTATIQSRILKLPHKISTFFGKTVPTATIQSRILKHRKRTILTYLTVSSNRYDPIEDTETLA